MILHLTKNLADKLKLAPKPMKTADEFFSWRANYAQGHGFRFVVFMNDASRFTVVVNEAKAARLRKLPELFIQTLREIFLAMGINPEIIDRYISELGEITFAKNADRKRTAQLSKNTETAWWALSDLSENDILDNAILSLYANNIIYNVSCREEVVRPKQKMLELLGRYGLPVIKCRAFDLNVRLALDGRDAVRRLRVPADIGFEKLHRLLQKAFGWQSCHLYSFGMLREWDISRYAHPDIELISSEQDMEYDPGAKFVTGVKLSDYAPEYRKILYTYDYGDGWLHQIEIESIIEDCREELPILLSGEGDSPPEDVGGSGGFAEFLEIIANPEHEEHENMIRWAESQHWERFNFETTAGRVKHRF